jgi:hypothetical protein
MNLTTYTADELRDEAARQARERQRRETRLAVLQQIDERLKADDLDLTADLLDPAGLASDLGLFTRQNNRKGRC